MNNVMALRRNAFALEGLLNGFEDTIEELCKEKDGDTEDERRKKEIAYDTFCAILCTTENLSDIVCDVTKNMEACDVSRAASRLDRR